MKVLHILYSGLGGSSSVVFSLLKENKKNFLIKQNILFTGNYLFKDYKYKTKNTNNNYFYIKTKKFFSWLSWFKTYFFLCREKPDLIFLHNFQFVPLLFYKFFFSKKIIFVDHQSEHFLKSRSLTTSFFSLIFFDCVIFVNKKKSLKFKKKFSFFKKKIHNISNSVDVNFFKKYKNKKNRNPFIIGMAARLDNSKKHELIIRTLNHQKLKSLNIFFSIAGDGENKSELKEIIKYEGLSNRVIFEGSLSENKIKLWYEKLNLYVHATNGEGMSISILEAMSMKIPVIGSDVVGVNNLLDVKPNTGMLFKNSNNDLADKIEYFVKLNENKKSLIIDNQRNFVTNNYSSLIMFENYKKLIIKILPKLNHRDL